MSKRLKKSFNLYITPEVYHRCKELSKTLGVNWSFVAESAFVGLIAQIDEMQRIIQEHKQSGQSVELLKAQLHLFVQQSYEKLEAEIESLE